MKYLKNNFGETIKCGFCDKKISNKDEIEYSREHCEYFCCPDCATSQYYEYEGSKPIEFDEAQSNNDHNIYGYNVM